jgi:ankyrin repeat protein
VLEAIRQRTGPALLTSLGLDDFESASHILERDPSLANEGGILHLMAKRGSSEAVKWLLNRGADPNALWNHWNAFVTPLHLAVLGDHPQVARELLEANADSTVRDSMHHSDALGWATFFRRQTIVDLITAKKP